MECREYISDRVRQQIDLSREMEDAEIQEIIDALIIQMGRKYALSLSQRQELGKSVFHSIRKMDVLQELVDCDEVTEIMVNGTENIFVEKAGRIYEWDKRFETREKLENVIQQIVARCNRVVNEALPIADARLENGSRVNIVLSPVALNGPIITIRRFPDHPISMEDLISFESITRQAADFLEKLVAAGYNIFISGGTGSGKTTFLNALSHYIPKTERIITIEDSAELQLQGIPNLVRLETRNANMDGAREITIRDLIKSSLRMRPDRIVIGEVRGKEAFDLLQAMNTGHDGSFSTGHGNGPRDMLARLETMVLMASDLPLSAVRGQIASAVDVMVHVARMRDKSRKVVAVEEVDGIENGEIILNPVFSCKEDGRLKKVGELKHKEKLRLAGYGL